MDPVRGINYAIQKATLKVSLILLAIIGIGFGLSYLASKNIDRKAILEVKTGRLVCAKKTGETTVLAIGIVTPKDVSGEYTLFDRGDVIFLDQNHPNGPKSVAYFAPPTAQRYAYADRIDLTYQEYEALKKCMPRTDEGPLKLEVVR